MKLQEQEGTTLRCANIEKRLAERHRVDTKNSILTQKKYQRHNVLVKTAYGSKMSPLQR